VLDIVVHKNVRLSEVIVCDTLYSDCLPIVSHFLDLSDPVYKFIDWKRVQSLPSELILPKIQINSGEEADKRTRVFTASIATAYRLSTSKIALSDLNMDLPGLESLLKHKRKSRKPWQVTQHPACKTVVNWVIKFMRRMTQRKALERWETIIGKCEVTRQTLWLIVKSLLKRDGQKAPIVIHDRLGITYHRNEKSNVTADC
jgi:hypothetical protein